MQIYIYVKWFPQFVLSFLSSNYCNSQDTYIEPL